MAVPYTFATATSSIPLSQLDANFATGITLGNTTVYLGNTTTSIGNLTLTNATISSVASTFPNSYLANSSVTIGSTNVSLGGTATTIAGLTLTSPTITGGTSTATQNLANVTGTLAVGNGGTGLTTLTAGYIPYGNGTSALGSSANLTWNGSTLQVNTVSTNGLSVQAGPVYLNGYSSASYISGQASLSSGGTFTAQNSGSGTIGMLGSGDMLFYTNSGLTVGNTFSPTERMRIDSSGNVGIGTSSPTTSLEVAATGVNQVGTVYTNTNTLNSAKSLGLSFGYDTANGGVIASAGVNKPVAFWRYDSGSTNYIQSAVIDGSGNLGLGVTPSAWYTAVKAIDVGSSAASYYSGGVTHNAYFDNTNVRWQYKNASSTAATFYNIQGGTHAWYTAPSGTAGNAITFTQAMTLDNSGNLGIGVTSMSQRMVVGGSADTRIQVDGSASGGIYFTQASSNAGTISGTTSRIAFFPGGYGEAMRIDSSGNLLVGKTTVADGESTQGAMFISDGRVAATTPEASFFSKLSSDGDVIKFHRGTATAVGSISVTTVATLYNTTSDYRLKTVIGSVENAGQRIDALEPIEYDWKNGGGRTRGFLAHKFAEVYPSSVSGEKDAVDEDGNPKYQGMQASSSEVMADLIAEIQSLRKRVALLESK